MSDFRQFKLSNNSEIVCKVLEWDNEETSAIVINNVLEVTSYDDPRGGTRFIAFRPWLTYTSNIKDVITINSNHVIAETIPGDDLLDNYKKTVTLISVRDDIAHVTFKTGRDEEEEDIDFEKLQDLINELVDSDAGDEIQKYIDSKNAGDSDSNVIPFRNPKTYH